MLSIKNLVRDVRRVSNNISVEITNGNNKIEFYEDALTLENHLDMNIYINDKFKESRIINILDHDELTITLETIINTIDSNLNSWSYEVVREKINGIITAIRTNNGLCFKNVWGQIDLISKCNYIGSSENLTNLMIINKVYTMDELLKLAEDNNIYKYTIKAIEYLRTA